MAEQFDPLDPLGIFGQVKKDVDRIATQAKLPPLRFRGNPGGKSRFIGGCKVKELLMDEHEGLCLAHRFAVSKGFGGWPGLRVASKGTKPFRKVKGAWILTTERRSNSRKTEARRMLPKISGLGQFLFGLPALIPILAHFPFLSELEN